MTTEDPVVLITAGDRRDADPTPGMVREQAIAVEGLWAGLVRTEAKMTSGWHHHGDHDTAIYVLDGVIRIEFGPAGQDVIEAGPGDFIHVPKDVIHRESNPSDHDSRIVVVRAGSGPTTINVDGPQVSPSKP
jgi:uncharacterized RmlC-like cupin family protein